MATPCQDAASAHLRCASAWAVGDMGCLGVAGCPEGLPCTYSASAASVACRLALASTMSSRRCGRGRGGGVGWGVRGTVGRAQHCAGCSARAQAGRHCPSRAPPGSARPTQHGCHHARWASLPTPSSGLLARDQGPGPKPAPRAIGAAERLLQTYALTTTCRASWAHSLCRISSISLCCSAWGWLSAST